MNTNAAKTANGEFILFAVFADSRLIRGIRIKYFMFEKLKQLKDLRDKAKHLQNALGAETITGDKNGIKITMDGNMNVSAVVLEKEMSKDEIEKKMPDAINEVIKKTQRVMAEKMRAMGGLPGM